MTTMATTSNDYDEIRRRILRFCPEELLHIGVLWNATKYLKAHGFLDKDKDGKFIDQNITLIDFDSDMMPDDGDTFSPEYFVYDVLRWTTEH